MQRDAIRLDLPDEPVIFTLSVDVSGKLDEPIEVLGASLMLHWIMELEVLSVKPLIKKLVFVDWLFDSPNCLYHHHYYNAAHHNHNAAHHNHNAAHHNHNASQTMPPTTTTTMLPTLSYCKDFLEDGNPGGWTGSLKTFEDTWRMSPGNAVEADIWLNDLPEDMLTGGFIILFDPALVNITNIIPYDTDNGGPWDPGLTTSQAVEPGAWVLALGNLACVVPDADGDIILGKVMFECQALGDANIEVSPIPEFDTVVGCLGTVYDPGISPNTITIQQVSDDLCTSNEDCDDGLYCNGTETCDIGGTDTCQPGIPVDCSIVEDQCNDGVCNEDADACEPDPVADDTPCDDGLYCTDSDVCAGGVCVGGPDRDCSAEDDQCNDGMCNEDADACEPDPVADDTPCDDGLYCTDSDVCAGGVCVGGPARDCSAEGDQCNDGVCNEGADVCEPDPVADDTSCDDGLYCTVTDTCQAGNCEGTGDPCPDGTVCNEENDSCDPVSPAVAFYCKDFLEAGNPGGWSGSLKTFDDEWALSPGATVDMDIWTNDVPEPMLTSGCIIVYDPALVDIPNVIPYDSNNGGTWDPGLTVSQEVEPGVWVLALGNLACVAPDADGDVILGRANVERLQSGNTTITVIPIPDFDTVLGCSGLLFDPQIPPNIVTINDAIAMSACFGDFDFDTDVDGSDAAIFKADFGRQHYDNPCTNDNPCNADFDCDGNVDGGDTFEFNLDFGRSSMNNPCQSSVTSSQCTY